MAFDIYAAVTDRIIAQLEQGIIPWEKPWTGVQSGAISGATGKAYSLLNQMLLVKPGRWYTFAQAQKLGGMVRKGEKSSMVVFWKQHPITETDPKTGEEIQVFVPVLRYFNVFHESQIDGLPEVTADTVTDHQEPIEAADEVIAGYVERSGILFQPITGSDEAYYSPRSDKVVVPAIEQFPDVAEYYSTAFHELTHSTGHSSRLGRIKQTAFFGNEEYSKEELVAEIGAAALMNYVGIETRKSLRNSAAYIQSWLRALKNDKRLIVSASGAASKAFDLITGTGAYAPVA